MPIHPSCSSRVCLPTSAVQELKRLGVDTILPWKSEDRALHGRLACVSATIVKRALLVVPRSFLE
eukprot:m.472763 g.472763  ORF g.472763 m.472763 type:complete len:65 (+) comp33238_c0_seq1:1726-1920(+)